MKTLTLALVAALFATPLVAQNRNCAPRDIVVKMLTEKHGESLRITGLINAENLIEIFVSEAGTFTVLVSGSNGIACQVSGGTNYEETHKDRLEPAGIDG